MGDSLVSGRNGRSNPVDVEMGAPTATDSGRSSSSSNEEEEEVRPPWMRVLHRVPPRLREKNKQAYNPSIVSLGPYHHGKPQFREFEKLKDELVNIMLEADHRRQLFRANILERIEDIRHFYGGLSRDEYDDEALAEMMLRDACVVLYFVEMIAANEEKVEEKRRFLFRRLGVFQMNLMWVDVVYKLENQIPWWLIKSLIKSAYDGHNKEEGEALMLRFLSFQTSGDFTKLRQLPWYLVRDEYFPFHLLEAIRITKLINPEVPKINNVLDLDRYGEEMATFKSCKWWRRKSYAPAAAGSFLEPGRRPFRSVTELKAKGIHFKPSSKFLLDIRFDSYYFFGVLHLPVLAVSEETGTAFSNMVALEMSPGTPCTDMAVTSYLVLMKSMIEDSKDVKARVFDEMKMRINDHCKSKAKTWIAELININFHSPWTVIALFAAAFLLCLTFLQSYSGIHCTRSISSSSRNSRLQNSPPCDPITRPRELTYSPALWCTPLSTSSQSS